MSVERCENCFFFVRAVHNGTPKNYGECRRYPPTQHREPALPDGDYPQLVSSQPETSVDSFCGEWAPAFRERAT